MPDNFQTCGHKQNGTNLVVCIDRTSNQFGQKNTNVTELYHLILKEAPDQQKTWSNSGIGTSSESLLSPNYYKKVIYHTIDLAIARDFRGTVLEAYRWLSENYNDGDCIFLFGFSRGAYQVRVLSAMIDKVGLMLKGNEMHIPFAYELYADPSTDDPLTATAVGSQMREAISIAQRFKSTFSHNIKVHFLGAWDTVSSVGLVRGVQMLPRTVDGMTHVCYFRHALALDERRVKFLPEYAYGGTSITQGTNNEDDQVILSLNPDVSVSPQPQEKAVSDSHLGHKISPQRPQTLEVWFAGTHSDIGGGNVQNEGMDRSLPPLRWMVFEAQSVGLRMAPFERGLSHVELMEVRESLTWPWWSLELLPIKRLTFTIRDNGKIFTNRPHLGSVRKIHCGQKIHDSLLSYHGHYRPKARPPEDGTTFWDRLRNEEDFRRKWVDIDLYEHAGSVMENFILYPNAPVDNLRSIAASGEGRRALYEKAIEAMKGDNSRLTKSRILEILIDVDQENSRKDSRFKRRPLGEIQYVLSDLLESEEYRKTAKEFIARFTNRCIKILRDHKFAVNSVAFSPNGKLMASASDDYTVLIWNVNTWTKIHQTGHLFMVSAVAFFPDGRHLVSGSWDGLRIWDVEMGNQLGEVLNGHEDSVTAVAISHDGEQIASGSRDMTVRIWNVATRQQVGAPFRGQTGSIQSVAFSHSGNCIASGSNDKTTWIWDLQTGKLVGKQAHEGSVMSVSFSPDGQVASSSADSTIRSFDPQTGAPMGKPFLGHEKDVLSVVFSPDGKWLASGSADKTVRVWDVETGEQMGVPLQGHTAGVRTVEFSPDGKWIVSGSIDNTIRIWDAGT